MSALGQTCPICGRIHPSDCVRAWRRFTLGAVPAYRANYPNAPERAYRSQAEADWCRHQQAGDES